jgi:hypothetical protein
VHSSTDAPQLPSFSSNIWIKDDTVLLALSQAKNGFFGNVQKLLADQVGQDLLSAGHSKG